MKAYFGSNLFNNSHMQPNTLFYHYCNEILNHAADVNWMFLITRPFWAFTVTTLEALSLPTHHAVCSPCFNLSFAHVSWSFFSNPGVDCVSSKLKESVSLSYPSPRVKHILAANYQNDFNIFYLSQSQLLGCFHFLFLVAIRLGPSSDTLAYVGIEQ